MGKKMSQGPGLLLGAQDPSGIDWSLSFVKHVSILVQCKPSAGIGEYMRGHVLRTSGLTECDVALSKYTSSLWSGSASGGSA